MTERGLENNASSKAVVSGEDIQLCVPAGVTTMSF